MVTIQTTRRFDAWFESLRDRQGKARIAARLRRVEMGYMGDAKTVGKGVQEMRVDCGPGYRIYFTRRGIEIVILLAGGDKDFQQRDIWPGRLETEDMTNVTLKRWDAVDHLHTDEDMALYLDACFAEDPGDGSLIRAALGDIARARGMTQLARDTGMAREGLYKALSSEGNPEFTTIMKVVRALGLRLHAQSANENREPGVSVQ